MSEKSQHSNSTQLEKAPPFVHHKILVHQNEDETPNSLALWMNRYYQVHVAGSSPHTRLAKMSDLQKFLLFFSHHIGSDHVDFWTPSLTREFQRYLQVTPRKELLAVEKKKKGRGEADQPKDDKPLAATSINRIMATLRHFGRFVSGQYAFKTGNPLQGVKDIGTDEPVWKGLSQREITRLKIACDHRRSLCTRKDQDPFMETAVFHCLLYTGLRESELASLTVGQYHSKGFHEVKRKGNKVTRKVPVPAEARNWLDQYLEGRGEAVQDYEPLFVTRNGNGIQRWDIYRITQRICNQANAQGDGIKLTPHMLRHTFLKRVADQHGVHVAQDMSGNISMREIFRYTKPSQEEKDEIAERVF